MQHWTEEKVNALLCTCLCFFLVRRVCYSMSVSTNKFCVNRAKSINSQKCLCELIVTRCPEKHGHWLLIVLRLRWDYLFPELVEQVHKAIVDHERDGNIEADTRQTWNGSLVEGERSFMLPDLNSTIECVLVSRSLKSLHSSFDDIDGRVSVNWSSTSNCTESSDQELWRFLVLITAFVPFTQCLHDVESDGLIWALLDDGCSDTFVKTRHAFLLDNATDSMCKSFELWFRASLVVDEFNLNGFHWSDGKNRLKHTSTETSQKLARSTQVAMFINKVEFDLLKASETEVKVLLLLVTLKKQKLRKMFMNLPNSWFRNWTVEKDGETTI